MRQHDLEGVAGSDVLLRTRHHAGELGRRRVRLRRHIERAFGEFGERLVERPVERVDDGGETLHGARERSLCVDAALGPNRRHHGHRVLDRVEHDDQRRAHHHRVGNPDRIGLAGRQVLHLPHHVVTEIAEHAGRHRRQRVGKFDAALGDQRAQRIERRRAARLERLGVSARAAIDRGLAVMRAPDEVRLEADDRIAAAHRAALDRLEQEAHGFATAELQEGGDRRLEIGDERRPNDLRFAARVPRGKGVLGRLDLHDYCSVEPPTTWFNADWLMLTL